MNQTISPSAVTLEQARKALEAGNVAEARRHLLATLQNDGDNFKAWLWLSGITQSAEASLDYARRANALAPTNPTVQTALTWAEQRVIQERAKQTAATDSKQTVQPNQAKLVQKKTRPRIVRSQISTPKINFDPPPDDLSSWLRWIFFLIALIVTLAALGIFIWISMSHKASTLYIAPISFVPEFSDNARTQAHPAQAKRRFLSSNPQPPLSVQWAVPPTSPPPYPDPIVVEYTAPPATATLAPTPIIITESGLLPKPALANSNPPPRWTVTSEPTPLTLFSAPLEGFAESASNLLHSAEIRWIDINLTTQTLTAYENGMPIYNTLISSGAPGMETVIGQFRIYLRYDLQTMNGYSLGYDYNTPNVPHVQYFHGNFGLHGAYWHENFGTPVSHGCVNLDEPDAEWLYSFSTIGTLVDVHY